MSTFANDFHRMDSMSKPKDIDELDKSVDQTDLKVEEIEVKSAIHTEENEDNKKISTKLELLKMLSAHLSNHNAKLHKKLKVSKSSLDTLNRRQSYIKEQTQKILDFMTH